MTTPSPEERLRRLSSNPGQPATKADIAELRSEMQIRDIQLRSEMQRIEHERQLESLRRKRHKAEKRCKAIERGALALYAVLFVVAGIILVAPAL